MKNLIYLLALLIGIACLNSCKDKEPFMDKILLDEWTLQWYEDANGNKIYEKPDDLPQNIILVLREDFSVGGQVASFSIGGSFSIEENGAIALNLAYPELVLCCEWDSLFLATSLIVENYEYIGGGYLRINYDNGSKSMLLSR